MSNNSDTKYRLIGASNHCKDERQSEDFYATHPQCVIDLLQREHFNNYVWEPACGQGHISQILKENGYTVLSSDIIDRGYNGTIIYDFLQNDLFSDDITNNIDYDIITNPPYKFSTEFVKQALSKVHEGRKIAMFLKLTFLEGRERYELFNTNPPKVVYVYSRRVACAKNGDFTVKNADGSTKLDKDGNEIELTSGAMAYAWFVWEKGYKGNSIIQWIN